MGLLSVFKKKESSILDTPPPMQLQTKPSPPLDLDFPPIPSLQSQQSMQSQQPQNTMGQMDAPPTFPDIPDETQMDLPPIQQQQQQNTIGQMDAPPTDFEFNIDDNLTTLQQPQQIAEQIMQQPMQKVSAQPIQVVQQFSSSNVYKEKVPEMQVTAPSRAFIQQQAIQKIPNKPIFVSLMQVKRAMNNVETLYNDVTIASDTIYRFFQLYTDMDQCYLQWQRTLDHLQEDMVDLDKALFRYS